MYAGKKVTILAFSGFRLEPKEVHGLKIVVVSKVSSISTKHHSISTNVKKLYKSSTLMCILHDPG